MKKISIVFGVFMLVSMTACKKSHVCECNTFIDGKEQPKVDNTTAINNMSKQNAIAECNLSDTTETTILGVNYSTNCELK